MSISRRTLLKGMAAMPLAMGSAFAAESLFTQPIQIMMGYAAGGTADISWRTIAPELSKRIGQPIVIQNRPGAGGIVGSQAALQAPADGHTYVLAATGNFGITPVLFNSLPFDPVEDFVMVSQAAAFDYVFAVGSDSPFGSIGDVIAYAKANPGKLSIGTVQVGSAQFFAAELFKSMSGIDAVTVPYRNSGDVVSAVRSGDVQLMVETITPVVAQIKAGAVKALGITGKESFPALPDVKPISGNGLDGYVVTAWNGLAAKKGTPEKAIAAMNSALKEVLELPEIQSRFIELGMVARHSTPEELRARQLEDIERWGKVMKETNLPKQ
ncbi:Bug family tripartite tricarboxylate transporter substrate binding protein [Paracandidimonas soli]|uniref:Tripartite-type tricarboxylate transporter receptor subunit TctC n=1 Tax=Paracandidimonas soli TaxID=1917182 RepID=A0A4R3V3T0_9BURK|nr:tripartite tricarboxylate transporter substrate binding protein [Paracandidimonas soli]TCU98330.1 tripartite-type tricarboxylate transporter receptor subunit TctC [Paracandidimonas soli]